MKDIKEIDKELYSFSVDVEKEVEKTTVTVDEKTKEETKITKKVKESIPVRIRLMRPTRRIMEQADLEYSKELNLRMRDGFLTKAMVVKKYADTGGVLTEEESKEILKMQKRQNDLMLEFMDLSTGPKKDKDQRKKLEKINEELTKVRNDLARVESSYSYLFQHTADMLAMNHVILWYILFLTRIEEPIQGDNTGEVKWVDFFKGETFEEKKEDYYIKDDDADSIYQLIAKKLLYFVSFWYNGAAITKEDFVDLEKELDNGEL